MAKAPLFSGKNLALLSALCLAALPAAVAAENLDGRAQNDTTKDGITRGRAETGGGSYGDQNRGGSRGFYGFPSHRSIGDESGDLAERSFSRTDPGIESFSRNTHGSAYYGRNYGAPYFDGGYYDRGNYYRERRD